MTEVIKAARAKGNVSSPAQIAATLKGQGMAVVHPQDDDLIRCAELLEQPVAGRNFTTIPKSANRPRVGSVLVAGRPGFWSWVLIDEMDGDLVYFHQVSAKHAASIAPLVAGTPTGV